MLHGGDGPGPLLTAAHANGWKMEDTDINNCLFSIIMCVGLADNCTFIFTTKYTDTLFKESSGSRLLSLSKEETLFIALLIKLKSNLCRQKQKGTSKVTVPE